MSFESNDRPDEASPRFPVISKYMIRLFRLLALVAFIAGGIILAGIYFIDLSDTPLIFLFGKESELLLMPSNFLLPAIYMLVIGILSIFVSIFIWDGDKFSHLVALAFTIVLFMIGWPVPFFGLILDIIGVMILCMTISQIDWPIKADYLVKGAIICLIVLGMAEIIFGLVIISGNMIYAVMDFIGVVEVPTYLGTYIFHALFSVVLGFFTIQLVSPVNEKEPSSFSWCIYVSLPTLVFMLLLPMEIGYPLLIFNLLLMILVAFPPEVRGLWITEFLEDMSPRMKETRYSLYLIRKSPLVVIGIIIIVAFAFIAIFAEQLAPYGAEQRLWEDIADPPSPEHIWGVDEVGGDVYSRILWGAQIDLRIAVQVVFVAVVVGTLIGAASGYYGGKLDEIVMRITDVFFAFPGLVLAMAIVMALGARNLDNISIALMITWWPTYARLVRGQVLSEREKLYVEAARSVGASDSRILLFHIIPNTIQPLIVQATMDTGGVLLTAAGLSFIGFGAGAGVAEWGLMISKGQEFLIQAPWMSLYPGLAILLTALSFNLVGDGIRDIMDPKLRRR